MNFVIRKCELNDVEDYASHCLLHMKEKGHEGTYSHPFPSNHLWNQEEFLQNIKKRWNNDPFSPNWEVAWVAIIDGKFTGHLNLRCGPIEAIKHRMRLGMGILEPYRGQGIGKALMKASLEWVKNQSQISWIDLSVFSHNIPAKKLYASFGFQELYNMKDAVRVEGVSIDDIQMVLKL